MIKGISVRHTSIVLLLLAFTILPGCFGVEIEFGPKERAMVNRLLNEIEKGIETFDIRGKQAVNVFDQLPAKLKKEGAELIEFQLTEWGSAMFGKGVVAMDCVAEGVNQRCIKNLEMVKEAFRRAVEKVNELEKENIPEEEKRRKWATFLRELRFEPVLLDPYIGFLDHENVKVQYSDATATRVVLRSPSDGLLKVRGTGLYAPRAKPSATREPTFTVWLVTDSAKEVGRKNISDCVFYTLDSTLQINLNIVRDSWPVDDKSFIEIVTKADPEKKVQIGRTNQIPIVFIDPAAPAAPPPAKVIDLVVGGHTAGDTKDENRGFHVEVSANGTVVGTMPKYCFGGRIKDDDFPSERFTNRAASEQEVPLFANAPNGPKIKVHVPAQIFKEFHVPSSGRLWVKASEHHDCECNFTLTYTVQTYKWGVYDRSKRQFPVVEDLRFNRKYTSPGHFFRGDDQAGTIAWDFSWELP